MIEPPPFINEFQKKMAELFENSPAKDIERNARAFMSSMLGKMDLVTREEFDVQREVLARTREQLTKLETRVQELEATLKTNPPA